MNIRDRIQSIIETNPSDIGVLINSGDTIIFAYNEKKPLRSASIIKLFVLSYYIDKNIPMDMKIKTDKSAYTHFSVISELGIREATIYELLLLMISSSDNTAANILSSLAGLDKINDYISSTLGLTETCMNRLMLDFEAALRGYDNFTTAADTVFILNRLSKNPAAMDILKRQKDLSGLMRYIYSGVDFYGKSGELCNVKNDSGILKSERGVAVAAVLTGNIDNKTAENLCGLCGLLAIGANEIIY